MYRQNDLFSVQLDSSIQELLILKYCILYVYNYICIYARALMKTYLKKKLAENFIFLRND